MDPRHRPALRTPDRRRRPGAVPGQEGRQEPFCSLRPRAEEDRSEDRSRTLAATGPRDGYSIAAATAPERVTPPSSLPGACPRLDRDDPPAGPKPLRRG